ncbi:general odorant-binding protein 67-like [Culex pipiens pallens]|uniref:general odorant-binding protein 67-like n=1 Tax=Culex pipiens pallens TaxID=42434 RepID=UPI001954FBCA|nr:general odorant-binding protein 67-like [Culex pipiens pallens]
MVLKLALYCFTLTTTLVLGQFRGQSGDESCFEHRDMADPNECCTRPMWVNRYMLKPCRYATSETETYRNDFDSCSVTCGVFKINMTMVNNRVEIVRLFKPTNLKAGSDQQWRQTISKSLKLCKEKITRMVGQHAQEHREQEQCEKAAVVFEDCLYAQMFLNCPERSWIRNDGCDMVKNHLMEGCPYESLDAVSTRDRNNDDDDDDDDNDGFEPVNSRQ